MHNLVYLIGRLANEIEVKEEDGKKVAYLTLAVQRQYKNEDGIYETDFIPCILWNGIANNLSEYCKMGDLLGIKGNLRTENDKLNVYVEKATFLSTKKDAEEE